MYIAASCSILILIACVMHCVRPDSTNNTRNYIALLLQLMRYQLCLLANNAHGKC